MVNVGLPGESYFPRSSKVIQPKVSSPLLAPVLAPGEQVIDLPPEQRTTIEPPPFGSKEYTEWYYNNPAGPGFNPNSNTVVRVEDTGHVKVIDQKTGKSTTTGFVTDTFRENNVKLGDNQYIPKATFEALPPRLQEIAKTKGINALNQFINEQNREILKQNLLDRQENDRIIQVQKNALDTLEPYRIGDTLEHPGLYKEMPAYDIAKALRMGVNEDVLKNAGFDAETIKSAKEFNKQDIGIDNYKAQYFKDRGWEIGLPDFKDPDYASRMQELEKHNKLATESYLKETGKTKFDLAKDLGVNIAEAVVPGVCVARNWNDLSAGQKALWISVDILSVLPFVSAAGIGARSVSTAGKLARFKGALVGSSREYTEAKGVVEKLSKAEGVVGELRNQITAPIDVIAHPIETVKGSAKQVREVTENILHPKKIPEAVITTANGTVRLKVTEATTPQEAKNIRDKLMVLASKGEKPIVEVNGIRYELSRSPLMQELGGGLAHASPQGEAFETGLTVAEKPGMPTQEQGLFMSHEPLPRFATSSAFGKTGEKPVIIITSPETARKAIPSNKLYQSPQGLVAEMELKFPVGTTIPEPVQKLFTRIGPDRTKVELWLEKPLNRYQIAKLKSLDLVEQIKAPFKPAINISGGATLDAKKAKELADILDASGNREIGRTLIQAERAVTAGKITQEAFRARTLEKTSTRSQVTAREDQAGSMRSRENQRPNARHDGLLREDRGQIEESHGNSPRANASRPRPTRVDSIRADTMGVDTSRIEPPIDTSRVDSARVDESRINPSRIESTRLDNNRTTIQSDTRSSGKGDKIEIELAGGERIKVDARDLESAVAWRQGIGWWLIMQPYDSRKRAFFVKQVPPQVKFIARGTGSAHRTIQPIKGIGPKRDYHYDLGTQDIILKSKPLGLRFKPDPLRKTKGDMNLKKPGKPPLKAQKIGKLYYIAGTGYTRRLPRGRRG